MSIFLLILGIVLFICLVIVHEYGHFLAARRNGVEVEEFGLFFPPRLWSKKMPSGFVLSFNAIPLGGFVRMKGEHDSDTTLGSFGMASLWGKTKIMLAGIFMNVLAAFVIFTFLAAVGMPQIIPNQYTVHSNTKVVPEKVLVGTVESNSPASSIGMEDQDTVVSIGPVTGPITQVENPALLPALTKSFAGQIVKVTFVNKAGQTEVKTVRLRSAQVVAASSSTKHPVGYLGIATVGSSSQFELQRSTWSAPIVALGLMKQITVLTFQALGHIIAGIFGGHPSQATKQVTGPVGVVVILKNSSTLGYQFVLFVIGLISLSLAIMNVLPIPALDGGRLFFTLIPRLFGRPIKQRTEELINGIGIILIILLFVLITVGDIKRIL